MFDLGLRARTERDRAHLQSRGVRRHLPWRLLAQSSRVLAANPKSISTARRRDASRRDLRAHAALRGFFASRGLVTVLASSARTSATMSLTCSSDSANASFDFCASLKVPRTVDLKTGPSALAIFGR